MIHATPADVAEGLPEAVVQLLTCQKDQLTSSEGSMNLLIILALLGVQRDAPHSVWLEAEYFGPLKGVNFSYMPVEQETKGSWSIAGPDTAPNWTQGGESEFMSVAARADEPGEVVIVRDAEIPAAGKYTL